MYRAVALALLVPVLGCGDREGDTDFGGEDLGPDRFAVETREGEVKMGLTDHHVYFALTEATAAEARAEMETDLEDREGIGGLIGGVVSGAVDKALDFRVRYEIQRIEDIRWEDDEMVIEFADGRRRWDEELMKVDDRPVTEAFDREAVEAFAEEFRRAKAELRGG